jgi:hypothetical protein
MWYLLCIVSWYCPIAWGGFPISWISKSEALLARRSQVYIWILAYLDLHDSFSYWIVQEKPHESRVTNFKTWLSVDYCFLKSKKRWSGLTWRASTDHWWTTILSTTPWITWYYCLTCWRWGSSSKRRYHQQPPLSSAKLSNIFIMWTTYYSVIAKTLLYIYFTYTCILYMAPSTCIFHELMWYLLCSIVYDFKIRGAVRRWLKLPN